MTFATFYVSLVPIHRQMYFLSNHHSHAFSILISTMEIIEPPTSTTTQSPTGYRKRTAQILRATHFYDLLM